MTCDDVRTTLPLHLTGDLPAGDADAIRGHLADCAGCRADHAELVQVRALLDAVPPPAVLPVDVAAVYAAAFETHARSARRWKRVAAAGAALAAGVLVAAVVPKLDVHVTGNEFAVRWGPPDPPAVRPEPTPVTDPAVLARLADLDARLARAGAAGTDAKLNALQDLVLTLAADVDDRDQRRKDELAALTRYLRAFEAGTREQFRETEKTNSALYTAVFDPANKEGAKP